QEAMLRRDHVSVTIAREAAAEPVAGLARAPVADRVGEDEVVAAGVERLTLAEELARELGPEEVRPAAGCPMEDKDRIADGPMPVPARLTEGAIVEPELGQALTRGEAVVAHHEVPFGRRGVVGRDGRGIGEQNQ